MPDWVNFAFNVFQFFFMIGVSIYVYLSNRDKANKAAIESVDKKVIIAENRITAVEKDIQHLPSIKDIRDVNGRISGVGQGLNKVEGQLIQINKTLHLMQQSLMTPDT